VSREYNFLFGSLLPERGRRTASGIMGKTRKKWDSVGEPKIAARSPLESGRERFSIRNNVFFGGLGCTGKVQGRGGGRNRKPPGINTNLLTEGSGGRRKVRRVGR